MSSGVRSSILVPALVFVTGAALFAAQAGGGSQSKGGGKRSVERVLDQSQIQRGKEVAPVPLELAGKNPSLVYLGSYIVNAQGACADCHSCPTFKEGHNPYQGGDGKLNDSNYLAGGVHFGPFVSANITPNPANGLPAGLTLDEFVQALRTGHDPDNPGELLQVMPWPVYGKMTDRDLAAVYEYLRSIPHAEPGSCGGSGE